MALQLLDLLREWLALGLIILAMPFFLAGTVGLLRFPEVCTRIHAVTKADNVGLGLLVAGLLLRNWSVATGAELLLIWVLVLSAGATAAHLVGAAALGPTPDPTLEPTPGPTPGPLPGPTRRALQDPARAPSAPAPASAPSPAPTPERRKEGRNPERQP